MFKVGDRVRATLGVPGRPEYPRGATGVIAEVSTSDYDSWICVTLDQDGNTFYCSHGLELIEPFTVVPTKQVVYSEDEPIPFL